VTAIELDDLIDELEDALAEGRRLPFSGGRLLVDEERLLDIIDRMRVAIPEEHKRARRIVQEQERLIAEAQARVQQVLEERGLLEAVDAERARLLQQAEQEAAQVRAGADEYARQVLEELDDRLTKLVTSVRNGLSTLGGVEGDPLRQG
jgi:cell division septum initiation protein DivIVA